MGISAFVNMNERKKKLMVGLKKLSWVAFAFFFLKGLAWLAAAYLVFK